MDSPKYLEKNVFIFFVNSAKLTNAPASSTHALLRSVLLRTNVCAMMHFDKRLYRLSLVFAVSLISWIRVQAQSTAIYTYWSFNEASALMTPDLALTAATIVFDPGAHSEAVSGTGQDFAAANAPNGVPAGSHLRVNLPIGATLDFGVSTIGYTNVVVRYETRRSGSGAGTQRISYSIDGIAFTHFTDVAPPDGAPEVVTLDFTEVSAVGNNPDFKIRIEFEQGTGGVEGNNRFDNFTVQGLGEDPPPIADIVLLHPIDKATNVALAPTFRWSGEIAPYVLQIATDKVFQQLVFEAGELTDSTLHLATPLIGGTVYYWRVGVAFEDTYSYSVPSEFRTAYGSPRPGMLHFSIDAGYNVGKIQEDIVFDIYGDSLLVGVVPTGINKNGLVATFVAPWSDSVAISSEVQESQWSSNDFSNDVLYNVYIDGQARAYTARLINTGLPIVYVNTLNDAPILSKDDYVSGSVRVVLSDGSTDILSETEIRGRGNSTWTKPKRPYRLKLASSASVFGFPENRDWVLLANYTDKTLVRTSLAFALGEDFGMEYANRSNQVEFVLNGVHQGTYLFGEHVKVAEERVNVTELTEDDEADDVITGGYFLEVDARLDEVNWFYSGQRGIPITIKAPEDITEKQLEYIKTYINDVELALASENFSSPEEGYAKYIDIESFIKWYWINELLKNNDAIFYSSVFLYKERGEKLKIGPLWDFDISAGNVNYNGNDNPSGWWVRLSPWYSRMFEDPAFRAAAYAFWNDRRDTLLPMMMNIIDDAVGELEISQELNFMKWQILDVYVEPNAVVLGSYVNEVEYLKSWLHNRFRWIDTQINPVPAVSFDLHAPTDNSIYNLASGQSGLEFTWQPSTSGSLYTVTFDTAGDDLPTIKSWTSESFGFENSLLLDSAQLAELFQVAGVEYGDTLTLNWRVAATISGDTIESSQTFTVALTNVDIVMSAETPQVKGTLDIYPNPTSGAFNLTLPLGAGVYAVEVVDVHGVSHVALDVSGDEVQVALSLDSLSPGVYIVTLRSGSSVVGRSRLIRL